MSWTKADRKKFLDRCELGKEFMPREVIKKQVSLFDGVIEEEVKVPGKKWQQLRIVLLYPSIDKNVDCNPVAKQSARFMVARHFNGPQKGEPIIFINQRTNKKDAMVKSYQTPLITNTTQMLQKQIMKQLNEQHANKYREAIFITRMEFIFKHNKSASQKMISDLKDNNFIYFKDTKPDLDNLEKLVWDAMQTQRVSEKKGANKTLEQHEQELNDALRGLVYDNDGQIVSKNGVFKRWGMVPGVIVELEGYA